MTFGPACERCGGCSYEGSMDPRPIRCPYCRKFKRRGSREELLEALAKAQHAITYAVWFVNNRRAPSGDDLQELSAICSDAIRAIEEA